MSQTRIRSSRVRSRGASCCRSDFLPLATSWQRLHGCLPSNVFTKATGRELRAEKLTNMPTQAIDCRNAQCNPNVSVRITTTTGLVSLENTAQPSGFTHPPSTPMFVGRIHSFQWEASFIEMFPRKKGLRRANRVFNWRSLPSDRKRRGLGHAARSALASLLILLVLFTSTLAFSASHRRGHQTDHAAAGPSCVFCLFSHGQVAAADVASFLPGDAVRFVGIVSLADFSVWTASDHRLSPSRAPPIVSPSATIDG
jgi:hypothetical protein